MILRQIQLILLSCLISSSIYSQHGIRLDKNIKLDTLRIWINYPADFDNKLIAKYDSIFDNTINQFNESASFVVEKDSINPNNRIILNMEPIKYVDTKRNILSTGLCLVLIGGHVYMISSYGWTVPIWPILLPATVSKVNLQIDQNIISSKPKAKIWISSNGYLMKRDKQCIKFEKHFDKDINKFLKRIDKQNIKNNKLQSSR